MTTCPSCKKEIAKGAVVCKHCGATLGTPERPTGVTVIAILCFVSALLSIVALVSLEKYTSIILGMNVRVIVAQLHAVVMACISVYCGVGLLKLKEVSRKIFIIYALYSLVGSTLYIFQLRANVIFMRQFKIAGAYDLDYKTLYPELSSLIGMAIVGYIIYYLLRHKDYFVN